MSMPAAPAGTRSGRAAQPDLGDQRVVSAWQPTARQPAARRRSGPRRDRRPITEPHPADGRCRSPGNSQYRICAATQTPVRQFKLSSLNQPRRHPSNYGASFLRASGQGAALPSRSDRRFNKSANDYDAVHGLPVRFDIQAACGFEFRRIRVDAVASSVTIANLGISCTPARPSRSRRAGNFRSIAALIGLAANLRALYRFGGKQKEGAFMGTWSYR